MVVVASERDHGGPGFRVGSSGQPPELSRAKLSSALSGLLTDKDASLSPSRREEEVPAAASVEEAEGEREKERERKLKERKKE